MTRVMFWNVNNFGYNRFFTNNNQGNPRGGIGGNTLAQAAAQRLTVLTNMVQAVWPDIFAVVEVVPGMNLLEGYVIQDESTLDLLGRLNGLQPPQGQAPRRYAVVPPVVSGRGRRSEGIAVFYDTNQLHFVGPWGWPGGYGQAQPVNTIPTLGWYPRNWRNALPQRQIPNGAPNAGLMENMLAGQWRFENPPGTVLDFPANGYRRPFLTTFYEQNGANRTIKLLSFHAPPDQFALLGQAVSVTGTARLANVDEVTGMLGNNEVACIVGDFNVSLFSNAAAAAYQGLLGANFTPGITRRRPGMGPLPDQFPEKSYLITHIRDWLVTPSSNNGYPGFGYVSVPDLFGRYDAIDNVFTRYGAAGGAVANVTIINPVVGSPYTLVNPAPSNAPMGNIISRSQMNDPNALPVPQGIVNPTLGELGHFRAWDNYGKVHSTSDHMPIAFDL